MTDDKLRVWCRALISQIEDCIDRDGEMYNVIEAVNTVMVFAKQMQAVGLREAAGEALKSEYYAAYNGVGAIQSWCEQMAKEREQP